LEIIWAQNQHFKLYRDGALYATSDRREGTPIKPGGDKEADAARTLLRGALDSMPSRARKLQPKKIKS
jgi:hypothetical protein